MKGNLRWLHLVFRVLFAAVIVALALMLVAIYFVDKYQLTQWQAPILTVLSVLQILIVVLLLLRLALAGYEKFCRKGNGSDLSAPPSDR